MLAPGLTPMHIKRFLCALFGHVEKYHRDHGYMCDRCNFFGRA